MTLDVLAVFAGLIVGAGVVWALAWLIGTALARWFPEDEQ